MGNSVADRFYTPEGVADQVASAALEGRGRVRSCVDAACGRGSLLRAIERARPGIRVYGVDADRTAIEHLRRRYPQWIVGVGNPLSSRSRSSSELLRDPPRVDLVVANPPFSIVRPRRTRVSYLGREIQCGTAMAHLLASLGAFRPRSGAFAIVPESCLVSELDCDARALIATEYSLELVSNLPGNTFGGARANSVLVALRPGAEPLSRGLSPAGANVRLKVTRGGLPVHEAMASDLGIPYVHSTAIRALAAGTLREEDLPRVSPLNRGRLRGFAVLLPRVGLPRDQGPAEVLFRKEVQLSDCVIALAPAYGTTRSAAVAWVRARWPRLVHQYRGTGARYITLARLSAVLELPQEGTT